MTTLLAIDYFNPSVGCGHNETKVFTLDGKVYFTKIGWRTNYIFSMDKEDCDRFVDFIINSFSAAENTEKFKKTWKIPGIYIIEGIGIDKESALENLKSNIYTRILSMIIYYTKYSTWAKPELMKYECSMSKEERQKVMNHLESL